MKKFICPLIAVVFIGSNFDEVAAAFESALPGSVSDKQLRKELTERGAIAQFVDVSGNVVSLNNGDGAAVVFDADGKAVGFRRADKTEVLTWTEPKDEAAAPAAPATPAPGSPAADDKAKADAKKVEDEKKK